jgi:hypothetical protein
VRGAVLDGRDPCSPSPLPASPLVEDRLTRLLLVVVLDLHRLAVPSRFVYVVVVLLVLFLLTCLLLPAGGC